MSMLVEAKIGECECCPATDTRITKHYGNMWFCDDCWSKEEALQAERLKPENVAARIDLARVPIDTAKVIDQTVETRTDLFNAATVAIVDLKHTIDNDATVTNKPYALATALMDRFEHFKKVAFSLNEQLVEANNNQKAIQVYLNQMANTLRQEEREKLKIADISYKPTPVKTPKVKEIKTSGTKSNKKLDKIALRNAAAETGISEFTIQMVCTSRGISVDEAVKVIKASLAAAQTQQ